MKKNTPTLNRRGFLKIAGATGIAATAPLFFIKGA
ncbi:MAG: twin-arginine translocation signal domain-containing protein, partial [Cocleimonas sp.]|nr:twin-arginine translocation signal domain-containing protein [Cocleimonas sp.]